MDEKKRREKDQIYIKLGIDSFMRDLDEKELDRINQELQSISLCQGHDYDLPVRPLEEMIAATKVLKDKIFEKLDLDVTSFPQEVDLEEKPTPMIDEMIKRLTVPINDTTPIIDVFKRAYELDIKKTNVFDIPVTGDPSKYSTFGKSRKGPVVIPQDKTVSKQFLREMPVLGEEIFLGTKEPTELIIGLYAHEITHMLVDRHKRVVKNYYYDELLPIFKEKEAMYEYDQSPDKHLYKIWEIARLRNLRDELESYKGAVDEYDKRESLKYIQSSLYAGILFDKYISANPAQRKNMRKIMKKVFNGELAVKKMLNTLGITLKKENIDAYLKKVESYAEKMKKYEKPKTRATEIPYDDERIAQGVTDADSKTLTQNTDKTRKDIEE